MKNLRVVVRLLALIAFGFFLLVLQNGGPFANAQAATGFPPFGTFNRDQIDTVNLANLNVHFQFPIFAK